MTSARRKAQGAASCLFCVYACTHKDTLIKQVDETPGGGYGKQREREAANVAKGIEHDCPTHLIREVKAA